MKKLIALVVLGLVALAGIAGAQRPVEPATDAQVHAAIDARLHELMVQLNSQHR